MLDCFSHPWKLANKSVHILELYKFTLVVVQKKRAHELGDAHLLNNVEQVNFSVKTALSLSENFFLFRKLSFSSAACAVDPATQAVDPLLEPYPVSVAVGETKDLPLLNGLFNRQLVLIKVSIQVLFKISSRFLAPSWRFVRVQFFN